MVRVGISLSELVENDARNFKYSPKSRYNGGHPGHGEKRHGPRSYYQEAKESGAPGAARSMTIYEGIADINADNAASEAARKYHREATHNKCRKGSIQAQEIARARSYERSKAKLLKNKNFINRLKEIR